MGKILILISVIFVSGLVIVDSFISHSKNFGRLKMTLNTITGTVDFSAIFQSVPTSRRKKKISWVK